MANKEITKVQALELALVVVDKAIEDKTFYNTDLFDSVDIWLLEKLEAMLNQQRKQDSAKRGESKTTKEKKANMEKVCQAFESVENTNFKTLSEIGAMIGLENASSQKISAIMKPLVEQGLFEKGLTNKKVSFRKK